MTRYILIVGCGYMGRMVAKKEVDSGAEVHAFVRTTQSVETLRQIGINAQALNLDEALGDVALSSIFYDVVYYFLPPQASGQVDIRIQKFLSFLSESCRVAKVVVISTTGVYGDCSGEWLDEQRVPRPVASRARRRLSAEKQSIAWAKRNGVAIVILRVGGIYGPGKLPLKRLKRGDPVLALSESPWSNRIYAKDLSEVCWRAARSRFVGVLNVVDGNPSTMTEYFLQIADFAGIPRPEQISMKDAKQQLGEGILSYLTESRRIGNRRLIEELGVDSIRFPSLDQGLADITLNGV